MARFFVRFKTLLTSLCLLLFSLGLMRSGISTEHLYLRTVLFEILFRIENVIYTTQDSVKNVFVNVSRIRTLEERLESAEQRLLRYRELVFSYDQLQQENEHLKSMLNIRAKLDYTAHYAKIIFRDPSLMTESFIVDKGRRDGIKLNMPVVFSSETNERLVLVGKIIEVAQNASKVRLATSKTFYLQVKLAQTHYSGILRGQGAWNQNLMLNYIPVEAVPFVGEDVITSGESEIYPAGLYIGKVRGVNRNIMEEFFQTIYVSPAFNYTSLSEVFILDYKNNFQISQLTETNNER